MKNISKSLIVLIVIMAMLLTGMTVVNAAGSSVGISLTSDSKLKAGETITVNVNFTQSNTEGIGSVKATLNYDSSVLEYVGAQGQSDWTTVYTAATKILGIERNNFTTKTGTIATITFKVKEGITAKSTKVSLNITEVGLTEEVSLAPSVTINAETAATGEETKTETPTTTVKPSNTAGNKTVSDKTTTKTTTLPKTGAKTGVAVVGTVAIIAVAGAIFYVRYINLKKYVK